MAKIADRITELIAPTVMDMGYELVGVEHKGSGKRSILRVYIDAENGIKINDCTRVSQQLSAIFDVEDPISNAYNLEVSSPGVARPLFHIKHYQRFLGHDIKLRLLRPLDGKRSFCGSIAKVSTLDNSIELTSELGAITLDIELIDKANLMIDY